MSDTVWWQTKFNEYTEAIKCFFEKYRYNPVYSYIEAMIPMGFTFSRPVELALSLGTSKDFSIQHSLSELCIKYCGGSKKIHELLHLLKALEMETGYFSFFKGKRGITILLFHRQSLLQSSFRIYLCWKKSMEKSKIPIIMWFPHWCAGISD